MSTAPDPADHDLDLAVELVNTYWVLASPPDRLTSIGAYQRILREAGEDNLAGQLGPADLPGLRGLRDSLHPVFAAGPAADAVALVDALLREAAVPARLTTAALAAQLTRSGTSRLGVCQAAPCTCVYVDRSRARTRRYCCDQCNDRAAAAAYRRRKNGPVA